MVNAAEIQLLLTLNDKVSDALKGVTGTLSDQQKKMNKIFKGMRTAGGAAL